MDAFTNADPEMNKFDAQWVSSYLIVFQKMKYFMLRIFSNHDITTVWCDSLCVMFLLYFVQGVAFLTQSDWDLKPKAKGFGSTKEEEGIRKGEKSCVSSIFFNISNLRTLLYYHFHHSSSSNQFTISRKPKKCSVCGTVPVSYYTYGDDNAKRMMKMSTHNFMTMKKTTKMNWHHESVQSDFFSIYWIFKFSHFHNFSFVHFSSFQSPKNLLTNQINQRPLPNPPT